MIRKAELGPKALEIDFGPADNAVGSVPADLTLDFDGEGNIVGVEILNLQDQGGKHLLDGWQPSVQDVPSWTYDPEVDAFYLRIVRSRSLDQRVVKGNLLLGNSGSLVGLRARLMD
jgi:uncharacterized protein YuzE